MKKIKLKNQKEVLPMLSDVVFKAVFNEQGKDLLRCMLNDLFHLDIEKEEDIQLLDRELSPTEVTRKTLRLDLLAKTKTETVSIEVQFQNDNDIRNRMSIYGGKLLGSILPKGGSYAEADRVIMVLITKSDINDKEDWMQFSDIRGRKYHDIQFTNLIEFCTIELRKLKRTDISLNEQSKWAYLFKVDNEDELNKLRRVDDVMEKAVDKLVYVSEDEIILRAYELAEKEKLIQQNQMILARREGLEEGIEKGIEQGIEQGIEKGIEKGRREAQRSMVTTMFNEKLSIETIARVTGLSLEEVSELIK